ncbi:hypothetical protein E2C01_046019 [Portunus trituberculatus]|uniref:Uncharacterized protein n=1 Tax=Portunus trituberculatus TaxID=210409 RepID=A0A5B7G3H5_PORTR|nr:hypothetical protein [Portunus trituberculatus]
MPADHTHKQEWEPDRRVGPNVESRHHLHTAHPLVSSSSGAGVSTSGEVHSAGNPVEGDWSAAQTPSSH